MRDSRASKRQDKRIVQQRVGRLSQPLCTGPDGHHGSEHARKLIGIREDRENEEKLKKQDC